MQNFKLIYAKTKKELESKFAEIFADYEDALITFERAWTNSEYIEMTVDNGDCNATFKIRIADHNGGERAHDVNKFIYTNEATRVQVDKWIWEAFNEGVKEIKWELE